MTSELCAYIVGVISGLIIVVGLFVAWMGQHNGAPSIYEDEHRYSGSAEVIGITPSDQFVAPDMSLDMALDASVKTREENERGWGELRNDGTIVIHSAPLVVSGDHLVNAEPIQVRMALHTADPTDELAEYASAAGYARRGVTWDSASNGLGEYWGRQADEAERWFAPMEPGEIRHIDGYGTKWSAGAYLDYWRELEVDPFALGELVGRLNRERTLSDE